MFELITVTTSPAAKVAKPPHRQAIPVPRICLSLNGDLVLILNPVASAQKSTISVPDPAPSGPNPEAGALPGNVNSMGVS